MVQSLLGGLGGASLGRATLQLTTDRKAYQKGLDSAEGEAERFGKRSAVAVAAGAAGFTVLAGAAVASVQSFAQAGDEVQKMAARTGLTTEALSELRFAAELSGAAFADLTPAIRRMQRVISQGDKASQLWRDSLAALGITVEQLRALSPDEQFFTIARALGEVADEAARTDIAFNVFGDSGTKLIPLLADGAAGLEAMRQEARDLGIVFDQEAADKAAKFNDDLTEMQAALRGLGFQIGGTIAPAVGNLATGVGGLATGFANLPGPLKTAVGLFGTMATTAPLVAIAMLRIGPAALSAAAGIRTMNIALAASPIGLAAVAASLLLTIGLYKLFADSADAAADAQARQARAAVIASESNIDAINTLINDLEREREVLETNDRAFRQRLRTARGLQGEQIEAARAIVANNEALEENASRLADLEAAQDLTRESTAELAADEAELQAQIDAASEAAREQADALRDVSSAALAASLAAEILDRNLGDVDFEQAFRGAIAELRPVVEQEQGIEALVESLLGVFEPVATAADETTDDLEELGDAATGTAEAAEGATDWLKELEKATREAVDRQRELNRESLSRAARNVQDLQAAALANPEAVTQAFLDSLAEQQRLAAEASEEFRRLNPDDPSVIPTSELTNYGTINVGQSDVSMTPVAPVEELIPA